MNSETPSTPPRRGLSPVVLGAIAAAAVVVIAIPYFAHVEHPASASPTDSTSVDPTLVAAGRTVFHGAGNCQMCHGPALQGGIGPTLLDHPWKDAKGGTLDAIFGVVTHGVAGTAMVSHPGGISDTQAHQVAAYVFAASHGQAKP